MCYFYNILLTQNFPEGRGRLCNRNKGDWFHSILLLSKIDIYTLKEGQKTVCDVLDFLKGPQLAFHKDTVKLLKKGVFQLMDSNGIVSDYRHFSDESSEGWSDLYPENIYRIAKEKWGDEKIPYTHNYSQAYNCIGFTDDIIHMLKYRQWNPRIEYLHNKYKLIN